MNKKIQTENAFSNRQTVYFAQRPHLAVTCPRCWTDQRAERERCYHCGAEFVFLKEATQPDRKGA